MEITNTLVSSPEEIANLFFDILNSGQIPVTEVMYKKKDGDIVFVRCKMDYDMHKDELVYKSLLPSITGKIEGRLAYDHSLSIGQNVENLERKFLSDIEEVC